MPCGGKFASANTDSRLTQATGAGCAPSPRARISAGAELLRQAQEPEVVDVHLGTCDVGAAAARRPRCAVHLGVVDQDVDLGAEGWPPSCDRARARQVQRAPRHLPSLASAVSARAASPGACAAHTAVRAGGDERAHEGLAERCLAVGDEHRAELRVAGHLAQLSVVGHVGCILIGKSQEHSHCRSGRGAHARAPAPAAVRPRRAGARSPSGRHRGAPVPAARAAARGRYRSWLWCRSVCASSSPPGVCALPPELHRSGSGGRPRAAGTARPRNRCTPAARSARRPRRP